MLSKLGIGVVALLGTASITMADRGDRYSGASNRGGVRTVDRGGDRGGDRSRSFDRTPDRNFDRSPSRSFDRGDFNRGDRYIAPRSRSNFNLNFGFSNGNYSNGSYFGASYSRGYSPYYYRPAPAIVYDRPYVYQQPIYVEPQPPVIIQQPVYVTPPVYYSPPVYVSPTPTYYYNNCSTGGTYSRTTYHYYSR